MTLRARRLAAVSGLTALVLLVVATVSLWSVQADVPYLTPYVLGASLIPVAVGLLTDRRWLLVPSLAAAAGVFAVFGGLLANGAVCLRPVADGWSITYDWRANVIRFGPTMAGGDHLCRAEPVRPLVVLGYLLATAGAYELSIGRSGRAPFRILSDRIRKQWKTDG